jgi:glycosyltransferase involved in cell wall biosynthesis
VESSIARSQVGANVAGGDVAPAAHVAPVAGENSRLVPARVLLIIPAFNESGNLPQLIGEIRRHCPNYDFVIINDSSTDDTGAVAQRLGGAVIHLPINLGIGGAVQTGIRYAFQERYDVCLQCDGDGQHDPGQAPALIEKIIRGEADLVIGSRFLGQGGFRSTAVRRAGIALLSRWIRWFSKQTVTDPTSGFRAMNRRLMNEFSHFYPQEYPEPESLYAVLHRGYRVLECPVTMRPREAGRSSIQRLDSLLYMIKVCLAVLVDWLRDAEPIESGEAS